MYNEILLVVFFLMWYLLVILALIYIISGLDDLFFDGYYWTRFVWRKWKTRHFEPLTYQKLANIEEQWIAVLIPCWHEANVIRTMLQHNSYSVDYNNYYFFVGVYPNDPETTAEVEGVAEQNERIQCVVGKIPGPTGKAANLNTIYQAIKAFEKEKQFQFNIFVLHDSEDIIHPLSFKLYNYLIPRKDMIQIPIFPLPVNFWNFTHWLYADEFAENHTKNIVVREAIKAHVPSAGVGTAFYRNALMRIEFPSTGLPFCTDSLTEDYRTSLAIRVQKLKQIFVTQYITRMRWKRRFIFFGAYVQKPVKEIVAVRALFPKTYKKAIRQKARWIIGIVFQEWRDGVWPKEWRIRYTLAHDRKSFITHFINGLGYLMFIFWVVYSVYTYAYPEYPVIQELFSLYPFAWSVVVVASSLMCERLIQRTIATYRIYGLLPACFVAPRALYGNILNLHALIRAYRIYFRNAKSNEAHKIPVWDKTEHSFPGTHVLVPYRKRLGDLLLEAQVITKERLQQAIVEQEKTSEQLGKILCRMKLISESELREFIAKQYGLSIYSLSEHHNAQTQCLPLMQKRIGKWLAKHGVVPVAVRDNRVTLAIVDPTNEHLLRKIISKLKRYQVQFMLVGT
jgi:adsorption protein B